MPPRVAIVTNYYVPELGMNTYYLCRGLGRLGVDVTLFCSDRFGKKKPVVRFEPGQIEEPFAVRRMPTRFMVSNVPLLRGLGGALRDGGFDVIQTEDAYQLYSTTASKVAARLGKPLLLRHDLAEPPKRQPYRIAFKMIEWAVSRKVVNLSRMAVTPTTAARDYLLGLRPDLPTKVIPFGVDEIFHPTPGDHDGFQILTVARMIWEKGLFELLQAFKMLGADAPEATLTIIGKGPKEQEVRVLVRVLKLEGRVRFIDFVRHDLLPEAYNSCDIFVLPSYEENPGLAILEAMACAKPVIAAQVPGPADAIVSGANGLLVQPRRILELYMAMSSLYQDRRLALALGARARETILKTHSWASICLEMKRTYEGLV